ncbi:MAG TPA: coproporphyrinogen-III oxidase family protein [Thermoanaerobaculia bacterium]|nr:coproporphyrinogen-III oxidase family protein [Thermoanaerobaculia bacterium]
MLNIVQDEVAQPEITRRGFITNYPQFRNWRTEAAGEGTAPKPLNLYLHLPYCLQHCAYCYYKTTTLYDTQKAEIDRYVSSLCREIEMASARFHLRERPVTSIYFGGGTPSLLSGENLNNIVTTLRKNLTLADPEFTVEGEPVTLTERKAKILQQHGVNRISIGIQSFCEEVVFKTGRKDTEAQAMESIRVAMDTGAVVNIDLISGLVGETPENWAYSVQRAIDCGAPSISLYKLEIYANTEYSTELRRQHITLPTDDEEMQYARYAIDTLRKAGYETINFFTMTKGGGYVQRHTTSKWLGVDNYAFGASAFGMLGNWAYQNTSDLEKYTLQLEAGELPTFRGYLYSSLDMMARDVILGMKLIHFDRKAFKKRHGMDLVRICGPELERLEADGFLTVSDDAITLTEKGILYGDYSGKVLASSIETLAS